MNKGEFNAEMAHLTGSRGYGGHDKHTNGGRYYDWSTGWSNDHPPIVEVLDRVRTALASEDPLERLLAMQALDLAHRYVSLPDSAWVVFSTYKSGWGGEGRTATWSAHATEEEAKRWAAAWDAHWQKEDKHRSDYATTYSTVGDFRAKFDKDGVAPHYLRRPNANPSDCIG